MIFQICKENVENKVNQIGSIKHNLEPVVKILHHTSGFNNVGKSRFLTSGLSWENAPVLEVIKLTSEKIWRRDNIKQVEKRKSRPRNTLNLYSSLGISPN